MINNNITKNAYSDEWYTSRATVETMLDIFPCNDTDTILCPFDSEDSQFVKVLQERGHKVIYGIRDFLENEREPYSFDCIYTNPPFSLKTDVIGRCIATGKKCTLVLPLDSLGGIKRHELYKKTNLFVYVPSKRINYYDEQGRKRNGASFHSIFLQLNADKNGIIYEYERVKP